MEIPGLRIDWDSSVPVYKQIAEAIQDATGSGGLRPGHRLPATRDLARRLGVNRNTVVAAYDHLAQEGWISSHTGRGTFLMDPLPAVAAGRALPAEGEGGDEAWFTGFSRAVSTTGGGGLQSIYRLAIATDGISFVGSYPADELMPVEPFAKAMNSALREAGSRSLAYGATAGYLPLRERIAAGMRTAGSHASARDILITNGAQQAIALVLRTLVDRGDAVAIEEPTYTGALSVLQALGARVVGVPVDEEGIRPDLLGLALERHRPRLLYVQPNFQNPTTALMSESRRRDVLAVAKRFRVPVVEDDWAGDLRLEGEPLPTLHALDGGRHVIYVSTYSKKLMPGLRIGWVAAPPKVQERLVELKRLEDCGTSPILQAALDVFLANDGLRTHLDRVLPEYRTRRDRMLQSLSREFPEAARWTQPAGGLFVWATLPGDFDGNELFVAARQRGVLYSRGELFHSDGSGRNCLRLTYSTATPDQIESGVATLGELVRQRLAQRQRPGREATVEATPIF